MSSVVALAQDSTALNLSLTGISVEEPADTKEAEARCDELLQDSIEVLILDEKMTGEFTERMKEKLARHKGDPLIVYCPPFDDEDTDVDAYLSSIIKPAVGFEIRLA